MITLFRKEVRIALFAGVLTLPCIASAIAWDFSGGDLQGWGMAGFEKVTDGGGWGDSYRATGWLPISSAGGPFVSQGQLWGAGGFLQAPVSGDITQYAGGSLSLSFVDSGISGGWDVANGNFSETGGVYHTAGVESSHFHPTVTLPYVFISGQVNGEWMLFGHLLHFSETSQTVNISLDASAWTAFELTWDSSFGPGDTAIALNGINSMVEDFATVLQNCDGIFIRSEWGVSQGSVGGPAGELIAVTQLASVSLIPEPSAYAFFGVASLFGMSVMRRRRK